MEQYLDTKFVVIGTGHIGTYMRMCYEGITGGRLRDQVVLSKATNNGLENLQSRFDCDIVVGDNLGALRKVQPDIVLVCPPPSQIPDVIEQALIPYCDEQREQGGTLPDIYTFGPTPSVDYFYERLGSDVNTVKVLPNMFYRTKDLDSAYLEANFITFSDAHPWNQWNRDRLYAFLSPLVNTYEVSEKDSVSWLGVRNAAHCLYDMCFLISDFMAKNGLPGDHRSASSVMRAALRQEWSDMPKELTPCSLQDLQPLPAEFAAACCVEWVKGLNDFSIDDKLPEHAGDIVRQNRVEAYLVTIGLHTREELEQHTKQHATKGGVCEKSGLYFQEYCAAELRNAFSQHMDGTLSNDFWHWWRDRGYDAAKTVAQHGLTLANR